MGEWISAETPPEQDGPYGAWVACYAAPGSFDNPFGEAGWYQGDVEYREGVFGHIYRGKFTAIGSDKAGITHWMPRWTGDGEPPEPRELVEARIAEKREELAELEQRIA